MYVMFDQRARLWMVALWIRVSGGINLLGWILKEINFKNNKNQVTERGELGTDK